MANDGVHAPGQRFQRWTAGALETCPGFGAGRRLATSSRRHDSPLRRRRAAGRRGPRAGGRRGGGASATGAQTAPDPTSPGQVVEAYLAAFRVGDCDEGGRWTSESFPGNGDLCGFVTIDDYTVNGAATPTPDQQVFAVDLHVTKGSADGTVPDGNVTWFYQLNRQSDGTWKIIGGGSGP